MHKELQLCNAVTGGESQLLCVKLKGKTVWEISVHLLGWDEKFQENNQSVSANVPEGIVRLREQLRLGSPGMHASVGS